MKLTTKKIKINQFYVKSIFTSLFLKVPVFTTSLRSLGSLFQQGAPLWAKDRCPVFHLYLGRFNSLLYPVFLRQ